jgi:hypothetical protein
MDERPSSKAQLLINSPAHHGTQGGYNIKKRQPLKPILLSLNPLQTHIQYISVILILLLSEVQILNTLFLDTKSVFSYNGLSSSIQATSQFRIKKR